MSLSKHISILENVTIFIYITGHDKPNCKAQEKYQHFGETISCCFNKILKALIQLAHHYVSLYQALFTVYPKIVLLGKFSPYFNNCISALDRTHIHCQVPASKTALFRNCKDFLRQNVLAVYEHDILFHYILPEWEKSAHNARVLGDAIQNKYFQIPERKYYLADTSYSNTNFMMVLYPGTQYYLKKQAQTAMKPVNKEELFNLRHARLCNIIERIFGIFKWRFNIFTKDLQFPFIT